MIATKINGKKYKIPTAFSDVTAKDLHQLKDVKPKTLLQVLAKIPESIIDLMSDEQVIALSDLMGFIHGYPQNMMLKEEVNVQKREWSKLELTKQALSHAEPHVVVHVCKLYFGEEVMKWPVNLLYGQTAQILDSLSLFLDRYKELSENDDYHPDDLEAGIKGLESFGAGAIRYSLAKGDVTKYEQIDNMSAESVYFTLLYEKAKGEYLKRKEMIIKRQQNAINT